MALKTGLLLLCMFVASSEAYLLPKFKELTYDYHAKVTVGSNIPEVSKSEYEIFADLHLKVFEKNNILSELKDVYYSSQTEEGAEEPPKRIKAPKEADAITLPFLFSTRRTRDPFKFTIFSNNNDTKWSIDIKRAIASLFVLDESTVLGEKFASEAKQVSEESIYGEVDSRYTHQLNYEGHMVFTKSTEEGEHFLRSYHSTVLHSDDSCSSGGASYYSVPKSFTHRKYDIAMKGNETYIYSVHSESSVSFSYNKDNYLGITSSVLKFKSMKDMIENDFGYGYGFGFGKKLNFENEYDIEPNDLRGGRRTSDTVSIKDKVKSIFFSVLDRVGNIKLNTSHFESDDRENIIVLIEEMRNLEENSLCELYTEILQNDKKQIETYALFLALTGTTESLSAIKKLIDGKIMDQDTAVKALHEVPITAVPNVLSIKKLMELVNDRSRYDKPIKEAAVLAMTRMIKDNSISYLRNNDFSEYVRHFVWKFELAKDYDEQLLCMTAFINMQTKEVTKYLEKIVNNEKPFKLSGHIRSLAILGIVHHNTWNFIEPRRIGQVLFPLFQNSSEDTEVRVTALRYIIKYGTDEDLLSLFWHMNKEKDHTFLDMFHSAVQSYSGSFSDCHRGKLSYFKNLYMYMPKLKSERKTGSSEYIMDYFDKLNGFGSLLKVSFHTNDDGFTSEYFQYTWKFGKSVYDQYSIYLYVKQNTLNSTKIMSLSDILALSGNDAKIELILFRYNLIVKVIKTTPVEILMIFNQLEQYMFDFPLTRILDQSLDQEVVVNSDVGVPVSFYTKKPSITLTQAVKSSDSLINLRLSRWSHGEYGLKVYNPIADTWHGVQRIQTGEINGYMDIEKINENSINWKVIDANNSPLGFKSVVRVEAFTDDGKSKISTSVANEELGEDYNFWSVDDDNTGLFYNFKIFDCKHEDRITLVNQIKHKFLLSSYKNPYDLPVMNLYLTGQYIWDYFSVFPSTSSCGVLMKIEKSPNYNMTSLEMINVYPPKYDLEFVVKVMYQKECINKFHIVREKFSKINGNASLILKVENLKSEINPNNENYILHINRESFVLSDELHSNFLITNGKNVNEMNNLINVTVNGKLSTEQGHDLNREYKIYKKCLDEMFSTMDKCVKKISFLRSYQYDISYDESNSKLNTIWKYLINFLRNTYSDRFEKITNTDEIYNGRVKLLVNYPIFPEEVVDLSILSSHESFTVKNIPFADFLYKEAVEPLSTYSDSSSDYQSYCEFTIYGVNKAGVSDVEKTVLPTKWTRMTGDCKNDSCSWELVAKKLDEFSDLTALRIVVEDETVDIHIDKAVEIYVNGKILDVSSDLRQYNTNWIDVMVFKVDSLVLIHMKNVPVNIQFNGRLGKISSQFRYGDGVCHN